MVEVVVTDEFRAWYEDLSLEEQESVFRVSSRFSKGAGYHWDSRTRVPSKAPGTACGSSGFSIRGVPTEFSTHSIPSGKRCCCSAVTRPENDRFYDQWVPRAAEIWERYLSERGLGKEG